MDLTTLKENLAAIIVALQNIIDSLEEPAPGPDPTPDPEPDPEPEPDSDPPVNGTLDEIVAVLQPGQWVHFGTPWRDLETQGLYDKQRDNCGRDLSKILGAWCGGLVDGDYFWAWAGGGHGDGCWNGILRYDLVNGRPEVIVPHMPLNVPLGRVYKYNSDGTAADLWNEPYVSETPWPAGMNLTKAEVLANGPWVDINDWQSVSDRFGAFLRPRSSHYYSNMVKDGDFIYLLTGQIWGSAKGDAQVWRFNVNDPLNTIERMPDRWNPNAGGDKGDTYGGVSANPTNIPGRGIYLFSGGDVVQCDLAAGQYTTSRNPVNVTGKTTVAWDNERQGLWAIDSQLARLFFMHEVNGVWEVDTSISIADSSLDKSIIGHAGIAVVPTPNGTNVLVIGANNKLIRWDGQTLTQTDSPAVNSDTIINKWWYDSKRGVCIGVFNTEVGLWIYKPDFSSPPPAPDPTPEPDPGPTPDPDPELPDFDAMATFHLFAGHIAAPASFTPTPIDQRIERQPEAPDYDALGSAPWHEMHVSEHYTRDDFAAAMRGISRSGTPNVRVFLHPSPDGKAYAPMKFDEIDCAELIGVPDGGRRPVIDGGIDPGRIGMIVRGVDLWHENVGFKGIKALNQYMRYIVLHDVRGIDAGAIWGVSSPTAPKTYVEFRGCIFGHNVDWHQFYLERSIGQVVALESAFYGAAGHAFKNLGDHTRIEGCVFSNVGLDGQPLKDPRGRELVANAALDLYLPGRIVFRNNTSIFRTANITLSHILLRGRNAWGNNDNGILRPDGVWEVWPPESEDYFTNDARWTEIAEAVKTFDQGYEAAMANPWTFPHLFEGNTFITVNAWIRDGVPVDWTVMANMESLRPIADNHVEDAMKILLADIVTKHAGDGAAILTAFDTEILTDWPHLGPVLRYYYDTLNDQRRSQMISSGKLQTNAVPIPAPGLWEERAGVFWKRGQKCITVNADGSGAVETPERGIDIRIPDRDPLVQAHPPKLIKT